MAKYSFLYMVTEENKNLWKAIKCTELVVSPLSDDFKKVTIFEETDEELEAVLNKNYDVINAMMN